MMPVTLLILSLLVAAPTLDRGAPAASAPAAVKKIHFEGIRRVCIDPGHGGSNHGAWTSIGAYEKDLTLPLGLALRDYLTAHTDLEIILTREGDESLTLPERVDIANQAQADAFVSLHVNSTDGIIAQGVETYFLAESASDEEAAKVAAFENLEPELDEPLRRATRRPVEAIVKTLTLRGAHQLSATLAKEVQRAMVTGTELHDRGVKSARFGVLRGLEMPGVVLELGFGSNPAEMEYIVSAGYRERAQRSLLDALLGMERAQASR